MLLDKAMEVEKEREELLSAASPTHALRKMLPTTVSMFLNLKEHEHSSQEIEQLKGLTAHCSPNCTTNTTLYKEVLRSHLYWEYLNGNDSSKSKSWSQLVKHLQSILRRMEDMYHAGNPNTRPDRESIHLLLQGAQNCLEFDIGESCVEMINDTGGFEIVLWYSRGEINDRSLVGLNAPDDEGQVGAGRMTYHIVEIVPMNDDLLNVSTSLDRELHKNKFNVGLHLN